MSAVSEGLRRQHTKFLKKWKERIKKRRIHTHKYAQWQLYTLDQQITLATKASSYIYNNNAYINLLVSKNDIQIATFHYAIHQSNEFIIVLYVFSVPSFKVFSKP